VHLFAFITKTSVTMHGDMNVKIICILFVFHMAHWW